MGTKRVVWVSELYPTRADPGRAAYLWPLLTHLRRRMPVALALLEEPGLEPDFAGLEGGGELPEARLPIPSVRRCRRVWIQTLLSGGALSGVGSLKPALLHAQFGAPSGILAAKAARRLGIPSVITVRGTDANTYLSSPVLGGMLRRALGEAGRLIAVSDSIAGILARHALDRVTVIENGVDLERFKPSDRLRARTELGLPPEGPVLLFVGHLTKAKGLGELAQALPAVRKVHPMLCTVLVGEGPVRFAGGGVRFPGPRPAKEIPRWLAAADLLCLPSHAEGRPNVVLEAIASGRPVVGTTVGALPSLVTPETGILVAPRDPGALAGALLAALSRHWDEKAIAAKASGWSWDETARKLEILYAGLLR